MFEKIYVEKHIIDSPKVKNILNRFNQSTVHLIDNLDDIFGRVKKPYLQKRDSLHLFLGHKKGQLVKIAPPAYGLGNEPHFYFVHAYNCIYECDYCYLQGYFHSPDIVLYLNHREIAEKIMEVSNAQLPHHSWFHAGEYSDSLALTHLSGELDEYFELFEKIPHATLELRTKSINIKELLKHKPLSNIITSFSLSPFKRSIKNDLKTPNTRARIQAIKTLHDNQFPIGIHFDPIIYDCDLETQYSQLIDELKLAIPIEKIRYLSLGVVRFTKDVFHQVQKNYPQTDLLHQEFIKSFDNKIRYNRPMRLWMLQKIKSLLVEKGMSENQIYFCMEEE